MLICHPLPPVYDSSSKVLILGTMPSPKSREVGFYYSHPQNRFWKVLAQVFSVEIGQDISSRTEFILQNHLALWDVLAECEIDGAQDSTIKNAKPNNLEPILAQSSIQAIFTTGRTAFSLYQKYLYPQIGKPALLLPSSSPANCRIKMEDMVKAYSAILDYL